MDREHLLVRNRVGVGVRLHTESERGQAVAQDCCRHGRDL